MSKNHGFRGGLHLDGKKSLALSTALQVMPTARTLYLPIAKPGQSRLDLYLSPGDSISAGQLLADIPGVMGTALHSPVNGVFACIIDHPLADGSAYPHLVLHPTTDQNSDDEPLNKTTTSDDFINTIDQAGVIGMGGAGYPTAKKFKATNAISTLIINAVECEPYICCDAALVIDRAEVVFRSILSCKDALEAARCIVAFEDNNPKAIAAFTPLLKQNPELEIAIIPAKFPAGGERQLIKNLLNIRLAPGQRPSDKGIICCNIATAYAAGQAIDHGLPLTHRIITLSGEALARPGNYWVAIGTPIGDLLDHAGAIMPAQISRGGSMMPKPIITVEATVGKTDNCILVRPLVEPLPTGPCIRCGQCEPVCPEGLLPQQLHWHALAEDMQKLRAFDLESCIHCACCDAVCPSSIALSAQFKTATSTLRERQTKEHRSRLAGERHAARTQRLERITEERKLALAAKKARLKQKEKP